MLVSFDGNAYSKRLIFEARAYMNTDGRSLGDWQGAKQRVAIFGLLNKRPAQKSRGSAGDGIRVSFQWLTIARGI